MDGLRIFVKTADLNPINENTRRRLDQFFLKDRYSEDEKTHVIRELNFFIDPIGIAVKNKINQEMRTATDGRIEEVVGRDFVLDWKTRLILSVVSDESFSWKTLNNPMISKSYFYSSHDRKTRNTLSVSLDFYIKESIK